MAQLRKDHFRKWLEQAPNRAEQPDYVGRRRDPYSCPIAEYLCEKYPSTSWHVSTSTARAAWRRGVEFALPAWARRFVKLVDSSGRSYRRIKPTTALRCLDQAIKETS